jgi:hypothetical protein
MRCSNEPIIAEREALSRCLTNTGPLFDTPNVLIGALCNAQIEDELRIPSNAARSCGDRWVDGTQTDIFGSCVTVI